MFYCEPVIGYRTWTVNPTTFDIMSRVMRKHSWSRTEATSAECVESDFRVMKTGTNPFHESPHRNCTCGLYGFHDVKLAKEYSPTTSKTLLGACAYWGRIVVATAGFRAEFARPLAFCDIQEDRNGQDDLGWPILLEQVVMSYEIPCVPEEDLVLYAETFGKSLNGDYLDDM